VITRKLTIVLAFVCLVVMPAVSADKNAPIEPDAGKWKTWVISSGKDYRAPAPPDPVQTRAELRSLAELISHTDATAREQIAFWDAGAPAYRWIDLITERLLAGTATTTYPHRVYTYVAQAMYDATVATWESKYFYNRARPSELDQNLCRYRTVRRIRQSTLPPPRQQPQSWRISCLRKRVRSRPWPKRRVGLVCLRVFSTRATTMLGWPWVKQWQNESSRRRSRMARTQSGAAACQLVLASGLAQILGMLRHHIGSPFY
jgi:hypothetical protein